jgi:hypothetical protein
VSVCARACVCARRKVTAKAAAADRAAKIKVSADELLRSGMRESAEAVKLVDGVTTDSPADAPDSRSKKRKSKDDLRAEEMHG